MFFQVQLPIAFEIQCLQLTLAIQILALGMKLRLLTLLLTLVAAQHRGNAVNPPAQSQKLPSYTSPAYQTQNPQQVNAGTWLNTSASKESFPRYLICGAEMTSNTNTMDYSCRITKTHNQPIRIICEGGKLIWERTNGIRFKSCNFENWDDQTSQQYYGSWEWTGLKMCPRHQFVYGYGTKINLNDGLSGLYLYCRNKFSGQTSIVTVKEGKGTFIGPYITNPAENQFAFDYSVKVNEDKGVSYITGLSLNYTAFPVITSLEVQYDSLPPWDVKVQYVSPMIRAQNHKNIDINYEFDQNRVIRDLLNLKTSIIAQRQKIYSFIMTNIKGKYHNYPIKRYLKDNFTLSFKTPIIRSKIQDSNLEVDRKIMFSVHHLPNDFQFGKTFGQHIPNYNLTMITIPKCQRVELINTIYSSFVSNPYTLTTVYTSGTNNYTEKIRGVYYGELIGRPQLKENYYHNYTCL